MYDQELLKQVSMGILELAEEFGFGIDMRFKKIFML